MDEELDYRRHPKIAVQRSQLGMDYKAGNFVIISGLLGMVIASIGVFAGYRLSATLIGLLLTIASYFFARKFIHAKPSNHFADFVASLTKPNYRPKK